MSHDDKDWWMGAIDGYREALLRVVAALLALVDVADHVAGATVPRHRRNHVLRLLRPAESAVRRLVVIAASRLAVIRSPEGVFMTGLDPARRPLRPAAGAAKRDAEPARTAPFPLADPLKRFSLRAPRRRPKAFPRVTILGSDPAPIPAGWQIAPDDAMDAAPLCRRLAVLQRVLGDIDGEARRLVRWQARRDRLLSRLAQDGDARDPARDGAKNRPRSPLRVGPPPGRRKRAVHEIDRILGDCHALALHALRSDTS